MVKFSVFERWRMTRIRGIRVMSVGLLAALAFGLVSFSSGPVSAAGLGIRPLPTPISEAKFLAAGSLLKQRPFTASQQESASNYFDYLCGKTLLPPLFSPGLNQTAAVDDLLEQVATKCGVSEARLDAQRGIVLSGMLDTQALLDRLSGVSESKASTFCRNVKASKRITKPVIVAALERLGLTPKGDTGVVSFAVGIAISQCSSILDYFGTT